MTIDFFPGSSLSKTEKDTINAFLEEYSNNLTNSSHNREYLKKFAELILKVILEPNLKKKETMINSFFSTTKIAPNCKEAPLGPATKKKCIAGLTAGFALLAASALALTVNPVLSIAVAAVAVGILLTSATVLLNGGPMFDYKKEERNILDTASNIRAV